MTTMKVNKYFSIYLILTIISGNVCALPGDDFIQPRFNTVDEFGVNVATRQPAPSIDTVSIGGELGLSHTVSGNGANFSIIGNDGYIDKYAGYLKRVPLGSNIYVDGVHYAYYTKLVYVLRASALGDSQDFKVIRNNTLVEDASYNTTDTFEALGDTRHSLVRDGNLLIWTKPDGGEVHFSGALVVKAVYPNGFTINFSPASITTNTGFQLYYHFVHDNRPIVSSGYSGINIPGVYPSDWSLSNPKHIYAINNAVEYCAPTDVLDHCTLTKDWPYATLEWPRNMPRDFWLRESKFKVTNSQGGVTEFRFEPHDVALWNPHDPNSAIYGTNVNRGEMIMPRLVGIKPAGADVETITYTYENDFDLYSANSGSLGVNIVTTLTSGPMGINSVGGFGIDLISVITRDPLGRLLSAKGVNGESHYWSGRTRAGAYAPKAYKGSTVEYVEGETPNTRARVSIYGDKIYYFESDNPVYEHHYRNFVERVSDFNGPNRTYAYDERGNLNSITYPAVAGQIVEFTADYPDTCSNPKTCNKPLWTEDASGRRTSFTYHSASGQVSTKTLPPNPQGLIAQTRYKYEQKYGYKKNSSNNLVRQSTPIWLKTAESYCANSNWIGDEWDGECEGGDEVLTEFEYNHNNLLMTGIAVTAKNERGVIQTLRTCYNYDNYGNQIGETAPKGNLNTSSCN